MRYIPVIILSLFIFIISCNNSTEPEEIKPGRRDYVWSIDSVDYGDLPGTIELYSIWGSSPDNVWGAGFTEDVRNCFWHFDGEKWSRAVWDTPITEPGEGSRIVGGVWGTSADDVWAFGGRIFSATETTAPFIMHFDGNEWTEVTGDETQMPDGFFDIYPIRKDHFWISTFEHVCEYKDGTWKKYFIGGDYINQSIEGIGQSVFLTAFPVGVDSLFLMELKEDNFAVIEKSSLFGQGKFGHLAIIFTNNQIFTFDDYGIYKAKLSNEKIVTDSWEVIISTSTKGFANSLKLSNQDIWAVGNYIYPYQYNGINWEPINIYPGNINFSGNVFWGIWGNGKEIFISDIENGKVYHGK